IWSSPGYSHCCFTAHSDLDSVLVEKITQAFVAIDAHDPAGKAVLEGEGCKAFVPPGQHEWDGFAYESLELRRRIKDVYELWDRSDVRRRGVCPYLFLIISVAPRSRRNQHPARRIRYSAAKHPGTFQLSSRPSG